MKGASCWIDDFYSCLSATHHSGLDIERAIQIKYENMQRTFFRYRACGDEGKESQDKFNKELENFEADTVWLSSPSEYNDPYDCAMTAQMGEISQAITEKHFDRLIANPNVEEYFTVEELNSVRCSKEDPVIQLILKGLEKDEILSSDKRSRAKAIFKDFSNKNQREILRAINNNNQRHMKVCSFSTINDSVVMWSHYANNHKGFCIEYNLETLPPEDKTWKYLCPVIYTDNLFDASKHLLEFVYNKSTINLLGILAALHKSTEWKYEKEWRLVLPEINPDSGRSYKMPSPTAVYLGARISNDAKCKIIETASKKGIKVYKMRLSESKFKMISENV